MKPLLVGLAPRSHAELGAFGATGSSSRRLAGLLGVDAEHLLDVVDAVNLSPEPLQSASVARWSMLAEDLDLGGRVVVACGRIVSTALGGPQEWGGWAFREADECLVTSIPHPSGLCREWNDRRIVAWGKYVLANAVRIAPMWADLIGRSDEKELLCAT